MAKTTDAQKRATLKYQKRVYTQINFKIKKEFRAEIENHVKKTGESIISFISRSVKNQIALDNSTTTADDAPSGKNAD